MTAIHTHTPRLFSVSWIKATVISVMVQLALAATSPAQVPASADQTAGEGIKLAPFWDSQLQGSQLTMDDLKRLLRPAFKPGLSLAPDPSITLYRGVTYLMPYRQAKETLGITQNIVPKAKMACAGFPRDSFYYYVFKGRFDGQYTHLYLVTDIRDQVVSVQLVNEVPKGGAHSANERWHTYNFINSRTKGNPRLRIGHRIVSNNQGVACIDSCLVDPGRTPGPYRVLEISRWYLPKPLAELILYTIDKAQRR